MVPIAVEYILVSLLNIMISFFRERQASEIWGLKTLARVFGCFPPVWVEWFGVSDPTLAIRKLRTKQKKIPPEKL
jgi:hypothetical protein